MQKMRRIQYAVKQGCVKAAQCILEAMFTVMVSRTTDLTAAENHLQHLQMTVRSRLTVPVGFS
jgi:hypothetical protein